MKKKKIVKIYAEPELLENLRLISLLEGETISYIAKTILKSYIEHYLWKENEDGKK